ncbi:MAG: DNA adenine methylase [Candidatus Promineifilaceae bacterium]
MAPDLPHFVDKARPFLKWAGGKSQLLKQYGPFFSRREEYQRYYEPFLGSAAVFFHLQPADACLADVNDKLVEIYQVVQKEVEGLIEVLGRFHNDEAEYYLVRSQNPAELNRVERAARLIYLNKTCYNGLYRENKKGAFNVPFGRYENPTICDPTRLRTASVALQGVKLQVDDFEKVVAPAGPGDFVYFDPPYAPLNTTSNFTNYNRLGFDIDDQRRLSSTFDQLATKGCRVMLSNSSAPLVYELYEGKGYRFVEIKARRFINSKADGRGPVTELLILNY